MSISSSAVHKLGDLTKLTGSIPQFFTFIGSVIHIREAGIVLTKFGKSESAAIVLADPTCPGLNVNLWGITILWLQSIKIGDLIQLSNVSVVQKPTLGASVNHRSRMAIICSSSSPTFTRRIFERRKAVFAFSFDTICKAIAWSKSILFQQPLSTPPATTTTTTPSPKRSAAKKIKREEYELEIIDDPRSPSSASRRRSRTGPALSDCILALTLTEAHPSLEHSPMLEISIVTELGESTSLVYRGSELKSKLQAGVVIEIRNAQMNDRTTVMLPMSSLGVLSPDDVRSVSLLEQFDPLLGSQICPISQLQLVDKFCVRRTRAMIEELWFPTLEEDLEETDSNLFLSKLLNDALSAVAKCTDGNDVFYVQISPRILYPLLGLTYPSNSVSDREISEKFCLRLLGHLRTSAARKEWFEFELTCSVQCDENDIETRTINARNIFPVTHE